MSHGTDHSAATPADQSSDQRHAVPLALAHGSACLATAMPLGKRMLLRDAPAILWRALGEDFNKRLEELSK